GAGKTGCALHPRSRVQLRTERRAHEHTGSAGASRPSLRNGFTAYFVLSPVNGSFATVADGTPPANLTPAPRRQDHTTSPYASGAYVLHTFRVHRIPPRVRDDRDPPLVTGETRGLVPLICPTSPARICPSGCFVAAGCRHCERSEAIHLSPCCGMDCFAALAMTATLIPSHTLRGP